MKTQTKHRIIGGVVLLAVLAIFLPLLFHNATPSASSGKKAPKPQVILQLPSQQQQPMTAPASGQSPLAQLPAQSPQSPPSSANQNQPPVSTATAVPPETEVAANPEVTAIPAAVSAASPPVASNPGQAESVPSANSIQQPSASSGPVSASTTCNSGAAGCSVSNSTLASGGSSSSKPTVIQSSPTQPNNLMGATQTPKAWVIQLASFSEKQNAKQLIKRLRKEGYQAYGRTSIDRSGRLLTHVFVGPEIQHSKIVKLQQRLQAEFHLKGIVRRYTV